MSPRTINQNTAIREKSRQKISNAALEVFAEDGYHHASVSKIAKRAEVSKGLMYNYFKSKEELIRALVREVILEAERQIRLPAEGELTDKDVKLFVKKSLTLVQENPTRWKLFFSVFLQKDVMALMMPEMMERAKKFIVPFINYFTAKGAKNPVATTRYFHASLDGVQMQIIHDPENFPVKEVRKMLIKQFVG